MATSFSNFAQRFCAQNHIDPSRFPAAIVRRSLHWPSRWFGWFAVRLKPDYFEADLELATYCGQQAASRDFESELQEFRYDTRNHGLWRGRLRQRVSTRRLRRLFYHTMSTD
ncbi:hypothetical protein [Actomonas aquatica]|uniref:HTH araC/xylS-type domain-containing protein n=1 Tax=Actomonas aquatica TaxID=2866162 RepID=A0ABZ1CDY7_9BACT|nr:hypothetical protein [Opitutus sp. WL0086]WRQ89875.1 hypothetical protein K1X11_010700 [Opitutus sp. WL0086]